MSFFLPALDAKLCQGDMFPADWDAGTNGAVGSVIVLSHDCETDKPTSPNVLVCKTYPMAGLSAGDRGNVRARKEWHSVHLEGSNPDSYASLREIIAIDKPKLMANLDKRSQSMTDDGKVYLVSRVTGFFAHDKPPGGWTVPGAIPTPPAQSAAP